MFPFSSQAPAAPAEPPAPVKSAAVHPLDALARGAFSAQTSGERMACLREWLATDPGSEQLQQVFKELSGKDKGAAKLLRERLDDIKRSKAQASIAQEWADKAQSLLTLPRLNLADALAWQRDAAKAGAPLSKEPLSTLKVQLAERVRVVEDLQHRVQVQREAAVLLAQRIEVLSTKPWQDAQSAQPGLAADVAGWQTQALALQDDLSWPSVDAKFVNQLQSAQAQLGLVWDAFGLALDSTLAAAADASAPLPSVPVWAEQIRAVRGVPAEAPAKPAKPKIDPEIRAQATQAVREVLQKLELEVAEGHGKASAGAANALRQALKEYGRLIDDKLEAQANSALAAAGELEGWQRWRADQLRQELVNQAEGLLQRPEGQAIGGRKMQETLRQLREQWKATDQGGVPNHGLWRRFDEACNQAHKVVEAWLDKLKAETAEHRAQRLALIDEVKAWALDNRSAKDDDWKGFARVLQGFGERWRASGHVGEKLYAELQPLWKAAFDEAEAPLLALQKDSLALRHALIDEAQALAAQSPLRIDAVKALQQRWQAEAHRVPLERRHEQKLWDAFRKPLDDAFARKTQEREKVEQALGAHDRAVLEASKALQAANASGDAQAIRSAMTALEQALRGQAQANANVAQNSEPNQPVAPVDQAPDASNNEAPSAPGEAPAEAAPAAAPARKPVVAMRGDDRPGVRREAPAMPSRPGRPGERSDPRRGPPGRPDARPEGRGDARFDPRSAERGPRGFDRPSAPRLGDAAFRAQREALEQAQLALRKLAAQAHGEALTQVLTAWEKRQPEALPSASELGATVATSTRAAWQKALEKPAAGEADTALLRLEMAAEVPTPAEHLSQRRLLQLQLLTRRNDPPPAQTWGQDMATVLAADFDPAHARRVQSALKTLLKGRD